MTIKEFVVKFKQIKKMGFIPTKRNGTTGIGYTLETLLGITENNIANPDIEGT
ncbi:MAG: MvaI/BcnI family restriction endonuclease [Endomicrobium sp.]|nr:MvaI/BcnI family restriction endonuclease [Endomicrobium sp.]